MRLRIKKTEEIYPNESELLADMHQLIKHLYRITSVGCTNLQLDDCTWGMIVDENFWKSMNDDFTVESLSQKYLT